MMDRSAAFPVLEWQEPVPRRLEEEHIHLSHVLSHETPAVLLVEIEVWIQVH
jgi:hypothetical protein